MRLSSVLYIQHNIPTRFIIVLQLQQLRLSGFFQQATERFEAVVGFIETGFAAFQCLLDHRTPDAAAAAAFGL